MEENNQPVEQAAPAPAPVPMAPAPEKKKGGAAGILCILFALIALGACGYIIYDKVIAKDESTTKCTDVAKDEEKGTDEKDGENESDGEVAAKGFVYNADYGTYYVTKDGDVYLKPTEWAINIGGISVVGAKFDQSESFGKYGSYTITNKDITDYTFSYFDEGDSTKVELNGFKIDTKDVVSIHMAGFGQSWNGWNTMFIKSDGSIDWLFVMPDFYNGTNAMKTKLTKNVGDYKNVVNAMNTSLADGLTVTLVTKDGGHMDIPVDTLTKLSSLE